METLRRPGRGGARLALAALVPALFLSGCRSAPADPSAPARSGPRAPEACREPELRDELLSMMRADQEYRNATLASQRDGRPREANARAHELGDVDARHTARMKEIVAEHGWPVRSLVGARASQAAWLLVQHADRDPAFQRRSLDLMRSAPAGEVAPSDQAYLTDRVLVNEGRPQVYGTQFWQVDGELVPRPIQDPARLDERRRAAGLVPMEEYEARMRRHAGAGSSPRAALQGR